MKRLISYAPTYRAALSSVTVFDGYEEVQRRIESDGSAGPIIVSFLNAHGLNLFFRDAGFREAILGSRLILRDGSGMKIAMRLSRMAPGANLNGTDFIPWYLRNNRGKRVAVFGAERPYLEAAVRRLKADGVDIAAHLDGFQSDAAYLDEVARTKPDILLLAMGMPKQEKLAARLARAAEHPMVILNGGAIVDFLAGKFPRAPSWMRRMGIEWLFRFVQEPKRLFGRYVIGNAVFVSRALAMAAIERLPFKDAVPMGVDKSAA